MDTKTYAAFLETLPGGAAVVDSHSRVVMMNQRARALLGAPDVIEGLKLELGDSGAQVRTLRRFDGGIESLAVRTSRMTPSRPSTTPPIRATRCRSCGGGRPRLAGSSSCAANTPTSGRRHKPISLNLWAAGL